MNVCIQNILMKIIPNFYFNIYNEQIVYFKECIESIINQDFKYIMEIVIVNDGSNM